MTPEGERERQQGRRCGGGRIFLRTQKPRDPVGYIHFGFMSRKIRGKVDKMASDSSKAPAHTDRARGHPKVKHSPLRTFLQTFFRPSVTAYAGMPLSHVPKPTEI